MHVGWMFLASALTAADAGAETLRMDEVQIEGHVQKPEVVFIADRAERVPPRDGIGALQDDLLRKIVDDARSLDTREPR